MPETTGGRLAKRKTNAWLSPAAETRSQRLGEAVCALPAHFHNYCGWHLACDYDTRAEIASWGRSGPSNTSSRSVVARWEAKG